MFTDGVVDNNDGSAFVDDLFDYARYHDVWSAHVDADDHYAAFGAGEGRAPSTRSDASFLTDRTIDGFDPVYYLRHNPDVAAAGVDPYQHFQPSAGARGAIRTRCSTPQAISRPTRTSRPQVPIRSITTIKFGWHEGRDPSVGFDTASYLAAYPDVAAAQVNPLEHYLAFGVHEGRSAFADGVWG